MRRPSRARRRFLPSSRSAFRGSATRNAVKSVLPRIFLCTRLNLKLRITPSAPGKLSMSRALNTSRTFHKYPLNKRMSQIIRPSKIVSRATACFSKSILGLSARSKPKCRRVQIKKCRFRTITSKLNTLPRIIQNQQWNHPP